MAELTEYLCNYEHFHFELFADAAIARIVLENGEHYADGLWLEIEVAYYCEQEFSTCYYLMLV